MNRATMDLWVGIFVTIGFGAIVFLALKVGNLTTLDTKASYRLEVNFDNIGGLKMRAPVKAASRRSLAFSGRPAYMAAHSTRGAVLMPE